MNATKLRADLYAVLDQVLETGQPVTIVRKGRRLKISVDESGTQNVYLDTHVVVMATQEAKFPRKAMSALRRATVLRISPASLLELQFFREIGHLNVPPADPRKLPECPLGLTMFWGPPRRCAFRNTVL